MRPGNCRTRISSGYGTPDQANCDSTAVIGHGLVPSAATSKQGVKLAQYGVKDPDSEWGDYVLLRPWDEPKFLASLRSAENTLCKQRRP